MKGFPKHINTKQDFKNLLEMPEYKKQCMNELKRVRDIDDTKITKCTLPKDPEDPESEWNTIEVDNPDPEWKRMKFESKKELTDLIIIMEEKQHDK